MRRFGTFNLPDDSIGSVDEPNESQWDKAQKTVNSYQDYSDSLVSDLLQACRSNDALRGSLITVAIHRKGDINLLMMVLVGLAGYAVYAEKMAQSAHGPLIEVDENIIDKIENEPWATSAVDQMKAAASNNDFLTFGSLAVDAHVKALIHDKERYGPDSIDLPHVMRAMMMLDQRTLSVVAAEALLQLMNVYECE